MNTSAILSKTNHGDMNTVTNIDVTVHSAPEHHAVQVRMNVMWV